MMRHPLRLAIGMSLVFWTGLVGCSEGFGSFSITEESGEKTVEGSGVRAPSGTPLDEAFPQLGFNIDLQEQLDQRNAGPAQAVRMKSFQLRITESSEGQNFDFLDSMTIFVDAENQAKQRIAWIEDVPEGQRRLDFTTDQEVNLKPYIEQGMTLKTEAKGRPPENDTPIKAKTTLIIDVI